MKSLSAMDQAASPLVLSGSASPASSDGGTAARMRDAEESLAVAEELQQQQQQQQLQTLLHSQEQYLAFRATLVHLLSSRDTAIREGGRTRAFARDSFAYDRIAADWADAIERIG